mmetsp:Transcript_6371/g.17943  ORF Transcript_6371/g.17943 Transcript_6371/m.17943 type:complete len:215 (+) Transcript_6371:251-895(+)
MLCTASKSCVCRAAWTKTASCWSCSASTVTMSCVFFVVVVDSSSLFGLLLWTGGRSCCCSCWDGGLVPVAICCFLLDGSSGRRCGGRARLFVLDFLKHKVDGGRGRTSSTTAAYDVKKSSCLLRSKSGRWRTNLRLSCCGGCCGGSVDDDNPSTRSISSSSSSAAVVQLWFLMSTGTKRHERGSCQICTASRFRCFCNRASGSATPSLRRSDRI